MSDWETSEAGLWWEAEYDHVAEKFREEEETYEAMIEYIGSQEEDMEFETLYYVSTGENGNIAYVGDMWVLYSPQTKRLFDKQGKGSSLRGAAYYKTPTWANKANERLFGDMLQVRQAKTLKVCLSGECMGQVYPVEKPIDLSVYPYSLPETKEPEQAVCFSAQPVMSSEEVPVLEAALA